MTQEPEMTQQDPGRELIERDPSLWGGVRPRFTPQQLADALGAHRPTPAQAEIIAAGLEPRLVVAGAGSGKTATMVDRVVWLVANGVVRSDQILGVTFTRKAAGELRDRVRGRLAVLRERGLTVDSGLPSGEDPGPVLDGAEADPEGEDPAAVPPDPTVLTYHSYAAALVRTYGLRIGVEPETALLGQTQVWQLAARVVERWDGHVEQDWKAGSLTEQVVSLASALSEHLLEPGAVQREAAQLAERIRAVPKPDPSTGSKKRGLGTRSKAALAALHRLEVLAPMVERFQEAKRQAEAMDFGDLLTHAASIAGQDEMCRQAERDRFRVVLLDEFQDTSHAQMMLFSQLFGGGHSVMAVGDPQQSIYGFRGASSGQLFGFARWFPQARGEAPGVSFLTTAWRNSLSVLGAANAVAGPLREPADWMGGEARGGLQEVPRLQPRRDPQTGEVSAPQGQVVLARFAAAEQEAAWIAERIAAVRAQLHPGELLDTAVLCRRRAQFEPVRRALEARGIPVQVGGMGGLLQTPEVQDVVAVLRVLTDPGRSDAAVRLLAGARWRVGARDLAALADWAAHLERRRTRAAQQGAAEQEEADLTAPDSAQEQAEEAAQEVVVEQDSVESASLIEALETLPRAGWTSAAGRCISEQGLARMRAFAAEVAGLRTWLGEDLPVLLTQIERVIGLDLELASRDPERARMGRQNLDALADAAVGLAATTGSQDVSAFLAWLEAAQKHEDPDSAAPDKDEHAVQLLTVHASKGLEWERVFVPGMNETHFPAKGHAWVAESGALPWFLRGDRGFLPQWEPALGDWQDLEDSLDRFVVEDAPEHFEAEERRLAYVAFTRARTLLALSSAAYSGTATTAQDPSRFLAELEPLVQAGEPGMVRGPWAEQTEIGANPAAARTQEAAWPYDPLEGPVIVQITQPPAAADDASAAAPYQAPAAADQPGPERVELPAPFAGRRAVMEQAARAVERGALDPQHDQVGAPPEQDQPAQGADPHAETADDPVTRRWEQDVELLLAARRTPEEAQELPLPSHVSASTVVELRRDPAEVLAQMRRPMPRRPGRAARAGTAFHTWVEGYLGSSAIFDLDELPGADDDVDEAYDLPRLAQTFRESEWGRRQPWALEHPIETPLETPAATLTVRGRIDAIYRTADGGWELVDWKTGRVPSGRELQDKAVQLAVYRLAWARLQQVPVERVSAAFYYVAADRTVRIAELADQQELERIITAALDGSA